MSRILSGLALLVALLAFGLMVERASHQENYEHRIQRLEILGCGFTQFEDLSVMVQADDRSRRMCADYIIGRIECDRVVRGESEYLVNCRD